MQRALAFHVGAHWYLHFALAFGYSAVLGGSATTNFLQTGQSVDLLCTNSKFCRLQDSADFMAAILQTGKFCRIAATEL